MKRVTSAIMYRDIGDMDGGSNLRNCRRKHTGVGGCICHLRQASIELSILMTSSSVNLSEGKRRGRCEIL